MAFLQQPSTVDLQQVTQIIDQLSQEQKLWLSGYLAAAAQHVAPVSSTQTTTEKQTHQLLSILYGSQTGNSAALAEQLYEQCQAQNIAAELLSLADVTTKQLKNKTHIALIISTHGEGEAPDDAEIFYEQIFSKRAPDLKHMQYSVLALGDSSYELFCHTGKALDERFHALGAQRIIDRMDCDVDYSEPATEWQALLLPEVEQALTKSSNITALPSLNTQQATVKSHDRNSPYHAEVLQTQKITADESDKVVYHLELGIDENAISYHAGDSIGIWAHNDASLVTEIIGLLQANGEDSYQFKNQSHSLNVLLTEKLELTQISKPFLQFAAEQLNDAQLKTISSDHEQFIAFVQNKQLIDLLHTYPALSQLPVQTLIDQWRGLTPRLYSIASSSAEFPDEIHLTVALEKKANHHGLASGLLCDRIQEGDEVAIYVDHNKNFKLPEDSDTDVIMIGPGTGIAPFRAFIQERQAQRANGKNWLFFGNPHFSSDFLYQTEWQRYQKQGLLNRIDLAWSRDQAEKVYVQDRLLERSTEVWQWIEQGAVIYVCGDANHMAKDVESVLIQIISEQGGMNTTTATDHLKTLKRNKKYLKDVY